MSTFRSNGIAGPDVQRVHIYCRPNILRDISAFALTAVSGALGKALTSLGASCAHRHLTCTACACCTLLTRLANAYLNTAGSVAMPALASTRQIVEDVVGTKGDDTVFEYVLSIVEDPDFDFGEDGADAFEAFGAVLVRTHSHAAVSNCLPS